MKVVPPRSEPSVAAPPSEPRRWPRIDNGRDSTTWASSTFRYGRTGRYGDTRRTSRPPNLIAAALAATTENSAIPLCGNSLALYNPPIRVAEEIAMLDCLSGGRVIAGMVFGTPMDSAFSYGIPPIELRERFHEARELITRAWHAEEPFAFNGRYTQLRYVNVWPRPIQECRTCRCRVCRTR